MTPRSMRPATGRRRVAAAAALLGALGACAKDDGRGGDRGEAAAATVRAADTTSLAGGDEAFHPLAVGDPAPALALRTLAGDTVRVGGDGPVTLVNVWATWCTSCREEMRDLQAIHHDFTGRGLRVLAVSVDDGDGTRVRRFAASLGLTMPVAHDPEGRIQELYQVMGVPETYIIGRDGRIVWRQVGGVHTDPGPLRAAVTKALM